MTIKDILASSDLLELLTFIPVDKIDLKVKQQKKSTLYYSESGGHIEGFIVLGLRHGICDMSYFKQELKLYGESACFTFEIINESQLQLLFCLTPRNSIVVDTNAELIPFGNVLGNGIDIYDAKKLKSVSHYTTVKSVIKILSNGIFIAKSLSRYTSEKSFYLSENSRRLIFITCFSCNHDNQDDMWRKFADNYKGCKIDLFFSESILEAFKLIKPLKCYTSNGELHYIPGGIKKKGNELESSCSAMVHFSEYFYKAKYTPEFSNKSNLICYDPSQGITNFTIVGETGSYVQSKYKFQDEVRIMLMLHSIIRNEIPFITKVELPFCFDYVNRIVITLGKNISLRNEMKLSNLISQLKGRYKNTNFSLEKAHE